jgi:hypothetical protein
MALSKVGSIAGVKIIGILGTLGLLSTALTISALGQEPPLEKHWS